MRTHWTRERDRQDNLPAAVSTLLAQMRIHAPHAAVRERLLAHPYFPSVLSARDVLADWNVAAQGIGVAASALSRAPMPALAFMTSGGGRFVVLRGTSGKTVDVIDPATGPVSVDETTFVREWGGVLLTARVDEAAGEPPRRSRARFDSASRLRATAAAFALFGLAVCLAMWPDLAPALRAVLAAKLVGLVASLSLVLLASRVSLPLVSDVCRRGGRFDCKRVMDSGPGRVAGRVPLADVGVVYFAGGFAALAAVGHAGAESAAWWLGALSLAAAGYGAFLTVYQAARLRAVCPLCLVAQLAIGAEAVAFLAWNAHGSGQSGALVSLAVGFAAAATAWGLLRATLAARERAEALSFELSRLRSHPSVVVALLSDSRKVDDGAQPGDVVVGPEEAAARMTVVVHPDCGPCASEFRDIDALLAALRGGVRLTVRFMCPEPDGAGRRFAASVVGLALAGDHDGAFRALRAWFLDGARSPAPPSDSSADAVLRAQDDWCSAHGIESTPSVVLHGRLLPPELRPGALLYFLRASRDAARCA
jgi:uncharacterized membrane protein